MTVNKATRTNHDEKRNPATVDPEKRREMEVEKLELEMGEETSDSESSKAESDMASPHLQSRKEKEQEETTTSKTQQPIPAKRRPHPKSLHSIASHRSYAGNDGYTCFSDAEEARPNISRTSRDSHGDQGSTASADNEPFLVQWENGDADPLNPRSMTKARKWGIVMIVSTSSLCV